MAHRQLGLVDKALCEMQSLSVRNSKRRCAKVLCKKSPQVAACYTESIREPLN
jgi:hypothetical protein